MYTSREASEVPKVIWTTEVGQAISHPAVAVGQSFLLATHHTTHESNTGRLQAYKFADGSLSWDYEFKQAKVSGIQILPLVGSNRKLVLVTSSDLNLDGDRGSIIALDEKGQKRWQSSLKENRISAPCVQNGKIIVATGTKKLLMISPQDDKDVVRQVPIDVESSLAAPAAENDTIFIPCRGSELLAVDLDGRSSWLFRFQSDDQDWLDKTPAVSDGRVFCCSSAGKLFALDAATGAALWRVSIGEGQALSKPVVHDGRVYVGTIRGLVALDIHNGWPLWSMETSRPVSAAPLPYFDTLFVSGQDHYLYALEAESGREKWRYGLGRRIELPPVIDQEILVVIDRGGMIVAFNNLSSLDINRKSGQRQNTAQLKLRKKAENYEWNSEPLQAAPIWVELGELDRAAQQFETAKAWQEAANVWEKLANFDRRAKALEQQALALSGHDGNAEQKAGAWVRATAAYKETGDKESRLRCEREVARWRKQPLLDIKAKVEGLTLYRWHELEYTVINSGFGLASSVTVSLRGERFQSQSEQTLSSPKLGPGAEYSHKMSIRPTEQGESVPLEFTIEFFDQEGNQHRYGRTITVQVISELSDETQPQAAITITQLSASSLAELARLPAGEHDLPALYYKLIQYFSRTDLDIIVSELDLTQEDFSPKLSLMAKELIINAVRSGRLEELVTICQSKRPKVAW